MTPLIKTGRKTAPSNQCPRINQYTTLSRFNKQQNLVSRRGKKRHHPKHVERFNLAHRMVMKTTFSALCSSRVVSLLFHIFSGSRSLSTNRRITSVPKANEAPGGSHSNAERVIERKSLERHKFRDINKVAACPPVSCAASCL